MLPYNCQYWKLESKLFILKTLGGLVCGLIDFRANRNGRVHIKWRTRIGSLQKLIGDWILRRLFCISWKQQSWRYSRKLRAIALSNRVWSHCSSKKTHLRSERDGASRLEGKWALYCQEHEEARRTESSWTGGGSQGFGSISPLGLRWRVQTAHKWIGLEGLWAPFWAIWKLGFLKVQDDYFF